MKRYVSLICIFCLLVMFVAKPIAVSASSFEPVSQDLVDLFSLQENDIRFYTPVNGQISVSFNAAAYFVGYVEFLLFTDGVVLEATAGGASCDIVRVGNYFRIYGRPRTTLVNIDLDLSVSSDTNYIYIVSADFSLNERLSSTVFCEVESLVTQEPFLYYYNGSLLNIPTSDNDFLNTDFRLRFYIDNYKAFDYINFSLKFLVSSITSVTVGIGDTLLVPFDVTYIENPAADVNNDDRFNYFVKISLDLSNIDLSSYNYPITVSISGVVEDLADSNYNYCAVLGVTGFILTSDPNPVIFWFRKTYHGLNTWFDSLLAVLQNVYSGNIQPGKSFQQQVDQKDQQLEDMAAVMDSVEQPDLNSVNVSANTYVDGTVLAASMSGITSVFSQGLFFDIIVMSIMMATAGYVLFGKR